MSGRTGTPGIRPAIAPRLDDRKVDDVTRDHAAKINELAKQPFVGAKVIADVEFADGIETPVAHGLGRVPTYVRESCPRGALANGWIVEVRDPSSPVDRSKYVVLKASGYGATITVDVQVA